MKQSEEVLKNRIIQLQDIIKEGIGDRSQKAFAFEIGITPEHFSRLMGSNYRFPPSKKLLKALSSGLANTNDLELFSLFDLEMDEEDLSASVVSSSIYLFLKEHIENTLNHKKLFKTPLDLLETILSSNPYEYNVLSENINVFYTNDEMLDIYTISFHIGDYDVIFQLGLVYYLLRGNDSVLVDKALFDLKDINRLFYNPLDNPIVRKPYICSVQYQKAESSNDNDRKKVLVLKKGIGFYLNETNKENLKSFVNSYLDDDFDLEVNGDNEFLYQKAVEVMSKRTKIPFEFVSDKKGKIGVIVDTDNADDMLVETIKHYAKTFGLKQYGFIHFLIEVESLEDVVYDI